MSVGGLWAVGSTQGAQGSVWAEAATGRARPGPSWEVCVRLQLADEDAQLQAQVPRSACDLSFQRVARECLGIVRVCVCVCVYVCLHVCVCVCSYTGACVSVCFVYVCLYTHLCVCVCVCVPVHACMGPGHGQRQALDTDRRDVGALGLRGDPVAAGNRVVWGELSTGAKSNPGREDGRCWQQ